jgi:alpha-tubulin suppressor-like RCC1 family protein
MPNQIICPHRLPAGVSAMAIASGDVHTCAIVLGGSVRCWGGNSVGQLGIGITTEQNIPVMTPVDVDLGSGLCVSLCHFEREEWVVVVVVGWVMGGIWSLARGREMAEQVLPFFFIFFPPLLLGVSAVSIAIGGGGVIYNWFSYTYTCVIVNGGGVKCWGANNVGQLGIGSTTDQNRPMDVSLVQGMCSVEFKSADFGPG